MPKSPEERTEELSSKNFDVLARDIRNVTVTIPGTDTSIVMVDPRPYPLSENQSSFYNPMQRMRPLDFWARFWPLRKMCLSLIVAMDGDRVGACVRVKRASRIDLKTGKPVSMPKESDVVPYLGLRPNEIGRLRYLDHTDTLYLIPTGVIVNKLSDLEDGRTEDADRALDKFFEDAKPL